MTYIVQRKDRFYVVAYDGIDPLTGRERRRRLPAGHDRTEDKMVTAQFVFRNDRATFLANSFTCSPVGGYRPWQCLALRPFPHGHGSFRGAWSSSVMTSSA